MEVLVAVDVVADGSQPGYGFGGEADLLVHREIDGYAVPGLVELDDRDEPCALKNAVGLGGAAPGEDLTSE
ncbi:hypothetical protein ACTWJ9_07400 [Streptomyces sp. GDS52]|uniref:hypothetical protein n=1 Tax=Streptomyces sp. GDS52 TaxID=3406419 RepID=UPI003FD27CCC